MKDRHSKEFLFKCEKGHDPDNFELGNGKRNFVPYCRKCRKTHPRGDTIITFGNLIYK